MNLGRLSAYWGRFRCDCAALVHKGKSLTWGELDFQAEAIAAALQELGVVKGDRVACLLNNSFEWAVSTVAAMKAGAILVPLDPACGDEELREIQRQVSCRVAVSAPALIRKLVPQGFPGWAGDSVHLYPLDKQKQGPVSWPAALSACAVPERVEADPADAAVICFTWGSGGTPKGAVHTHQGILGFAHGFVTALQWTSEERVLMLDPFPHVAGVIGSFTPVCAAGACIYIAEEPEAAHALQLLIEEEVTALRAASSVWERMVVCSGFAEADLHALRSAICSGAPLSGTVLQACAVKDIPIRQSYSNIEGGGMLTLPTAEDALIKPWSCGGPLASVDIRIVDRQGSSCEAGESGEILIRGPQVMTGYWESPESDDKTWVDGWCRTGGVGLLDEAGHLQLVDQN